MIDNRQNVRFAIRVHQAGEGGTRHSELHFRLDQSSPADTMMEASLSPKLSFQAKGTRATRDYWAFTMKTIARWRRRRSCRRRFALRVVNTNLIGLPVGAFEGLAITSNSSKIRCVLLCCLTVAVFLFHHCSFFAHAICPLPSKRTTARHRRQSRRMGAPPQALPAHNRRGEPWAFTAVVKRRLADSSFVS